MCWILAGVGSIERGGCGIHGELDYTYGLGNGRFLDGGMWGCCG